MVIFEPKGVCSKKISFEVENNKVKFIEFQGGCNGNLQGLSKLLIGMDINEAISRLKGIKCGSKDTSCPDQTAIALQSVLK